MVHMFTLDCTLPAPLVWALQWGPKKIMKVVSCRYTAGKASPEQEHGVEFIIGQRVFALVLHAYLCESLSRLLS